MAEPKIVIIAGPNGAGKTTFARAFLPQEAQVLRFINADLIAAGLSPFAPEAAALRAGRLMLDELDACTRRRESFAFETTLSGLAYLRHIGAWRRAGYHVSLFFLALPDPELAVARVAERVRQGGHHIPDDVVRRRFHAGRDNFEQRYRQAVDAWALYDNSGEEPMLIDWGEAPVSARPISQARDRDLPASLAALRRAAAAARETAARTGTAIVIVRDRKMVRVAGPALQPSRER